MTNRYLEYVETLSHVFKVKSIILIIFSIVFIIGIIFFVFKNEKRLAVICTILMVIFASSFYFIGIHTIKKDISRQSFIKYEGDFHISDLYKESKGETRIYIEPSSPSKLKHIRAYYKLRCSANGYDGPGKYTGYFVYAEHSGYMVELYCNKNQSNQSGDGSMC